MPTLESLPAEVSFEVLRRRYPDLAALGDAEMQVHFDTLGRNEGRVASEASLREEFLTLIDPAKKILEIGPFCQPVFVGPEVRYLDVLNAEQLALRAVELGIDASRCPAEIHYTNGLAAAAGADFDFIFSSHNLEHQPDLIGHLNQAAAAMSETGLYCLLIPDKRYCFDHFLPETTVADIIEAHIEKRTTHAMRNVIEHGALTCHNEAVQHWQENHGSRPDGLDGRLSAVLDRIALAGDAYVDVHAWKLTPMRLREVLKTLNQLNLINLQPARIYDTPWGRNEFAVILRRIA